MRIPDRFAKTLQKALRQKLMDHIGWFKTQAKRKK
jgi:hypothetical protein